MFHSIIFILKYMERVLDMAKAVKKSKIKLISSFELSLMMDKTLSFGLSYKWGRFLNTSF